MKNEFVLKKVTVIYFCSSFSRQWLQWAYQELLAGELLAARLVVRWAHTIYFAVISYDQSFTWSRATQRNRIPAVRRLLLLLWYLHSSYRSNSISTLTLCQDFESTAWHLVASGLLLNYLRRRLSHFLTIWDFIMVIELMALLKKVHPGQPSLNCSFIHIFDRLINYRLS